MAARIRMSCTYFIINTLYLSAPSLSAPLPSECSCPSSPLSPSTIDYVLSMTVERQLTPQECAFICNPSPPLPPTTYNSVNKQDSLFAKPDQQQQSGVPLEEEINGEDEGDIDFRVEQSQDLHPPEQSAPFAFSDGFPLRDFSAAANRHSKSPTHVPIRPDHTFPSSSLPLPTRPPTAALPIFALIIAIFIFAACLIKYSQRHTTGVSWTPQARRWFSLSGDFTKDVEAWRGCLDEEKEGAQRARFEKEQEGEREKEKGKNNGVKRWA